MTYSNPGVLTQAKRDQHLSVDRLGRTMLAFHQLEGAIGRVFGNDSGDDQYDKNLPYYNNVAWSFSYFLDAIQEARSLLLDYYELSPADNRRFRFLDVGCGTGTKMFVAKECDWAVHGVEMNTMLATIARSVNGSEDAVTRCNALHYDGYDKFDCIYYYVPIRDGKLMSDLSKRIYSGATPGTVVISAIFREECSDHQNEYGFRAFQPFCYLKCGQEAFDRVTEARKKRRENALLEVKK